MVQYTRNHRLQEYQRDERPWTHAPDMQHIDRRLVIRDTVSNLPNYYGFRESIFISTDTNEMFLPANNGSGGWVPARLQLSALQTGQITGSITGNQSLTTLAGSGLDIQNGALTAVPDEEASPMPTSQVVTAGTTTAPNHSNMLADASSGPVTVELPPPATNVHVTVKKTDASAHAVTIATPGVQTIDGQADRTVETQYVSLTIGSDGTDYYII